VAALLPNLDPGWRVLDLGCGPGRWTLPFARACREVVAVDFSHAMLEHARRRCQAGGVGGKVRFVQSGLAELDPVALGRFDLVLLMGVLQFVPDLQLGGVLEKAAACVAPQGRALHRETRVRRNCRKEYHAQGGGLMMSSHYKTFGHYRAAFESAGLHLRGRRSILPPNLLYSIFSRIRRGPGMDGPVLKSIIGLHENFIDPLWRLFPALLWKVNSRRPTDQAAVLYQRSAP
jgi:SAM-dependent methyltransferase